MNTPSNVVVEAIAKLNADNAEMVTGEAVRIIGCIRHEQDKISACEVRIEAYREEANTLAKSEITETSVLGSPLPSNSNRETIAKVLEKANKDRQYNVEQSASRLTAAIVSEQDAVTLIEKRIVELRAGLLKLTVPTVTEAQVLG